MPIRLIALDVDGTLIDHSKIISERNLAAIRAAQDSGVFVTVATGRGYLASRDIWAQLNILGPVITYGGALVKDTRTEECVSLAAIAPDVVTDTLEYAKSIGEHAQIYQGDLVIAEHDHPFFARYREFLGIPSRIDPDVRQKRWENVPKILVYTDPAAEDEVRGKIAAFLGGRAAVSKSQPGYIEINSPSATKANALSAMASYMGIARSDVAAVGDSYLDISMIEWAGIGVCVENGLPEVKAVSDLIVPACDRDGVAVFIEQYVLS